jgi:hypothetical protein
MKKNTKKKLILTDAERQELLQRVMAGKLSAKEENELLQILEADLKERAFEDYELYASHYIYIIDKNGNRVRFKHNGIQKKINQTVERLRAQGKPVRIIMLKARQHGASTNEQGRMLKNTSTKKNRKGLIVAHDVDATTTIFNKSKYMYDNLPTHVKPLQKASNAKELIFDRPTGYKGKGEGLNSSISIQVAGKTSIGRGDTFHYVHLSEFAHWPSPEGQEPKKQLAGILNAVPKTLDTEVVIETTANGYNDFKELWNDAVDGLNEWTPLFFPWHENPEYQMPCTEEEYQRLLDRILDNRVREYLLGKNDGKSPGIIELFNLSKEQIRWWLWTLENDCLSDFNMMLQENPAMPDDAFLATGTPVFDNEKIRLRIEYLKQKYRKHPPKQGRFTFEWGNHETCDYIKDGTIKWIDDPHGFITIYEQPQEGYPYVIGGDTKGEGRDFYSGTVINNVTGNRAATIRNQWNNSKPYTWQIYCLAMYYNLALVGIEVNFNTAPIEELERLNYPRQYTRQRYDDFTHEYKSSYGWKTDGNTRPLIIDKEVHLINENIELFNDITMLEECLTFVYDKKGRPDAISGKHDDALFSDMIANEIRTQQSFEAEIKPEPYRPGSFDEDTENRIEYSVSPFD